MKSNRFIKIYYSVLDMELTSMQLLVYSTLLSMRKKEHYTVASASAISKRCGCHPNSVAKAISALENVGLIQKLNRYKDGKYIANLYKLAAMDAGSYVKVDYYILSSKLLPGSFAAYLYILRRANTTP